MARRIHWYSILGFLVSFQYAVGSVHAQSRDGGGGALGDIIVWAIQEAIKVLVSPLRWIIQNHANTAISIIIGAPHPNTVFRAPTNSPWDGIYNYYWETIIPLALLIWALSIGIVIFLESTSYLFSSYHRTKLKRRAFSGLLGVLGWWWLDALSRQFIHELAIFIAPDLSTISLFETLSFGSLGALVTAITLSVDFFLLVLVILIYFIREVVLYLFTLLMPVLIVLWIPGVGPFGLVSKFMKRLAGFYVPFLFMTIPVAVLFRLGQILGENFGFSVTGLGLWLTALVIPIVAILSPFILFWQAGSIFFMAQSASRHTSARRARGRLGRASSAGAKTVHSGRNFVRGARGQAAVTADGQAVFNSGDSRTHAAGSRLNDAGGQLRSALSRSSNTNTGQSAETDGGSTGNDSGEPTRRSLDDTSERRDRRQHSLDETTATTDEPTDTTDNSESARPSGNDLSASRPSPTDERTTVDDDEHRIDDEPRYIQ